MAGHSEAHKLGKEEVRWGGGVQGVRGAEVTTRGVVWAPRSE